MKRKILSLLTILISLTLVLDGGVPDEDDLVVKSSKVGLATPYIRLRCQI